MILPVILAGGSGTRLWPLSRAKYPKQFLPLVGEQTLLQKTATRLDGLLDLAPPVVVCNEEYRFIVAQQMHEIGQTEARIILEPGARNTAPAAALAALLARETGDDPILALLPADHAILDEARFRVALEQAAGCAADGEIVTFGVVPTGPETGYGYIRAGTGIGGKARRVDEFVEKPDLDTARRYIADGGYFWNSGVFVFRASAYLDELAGFEPEIHAACVKAMDDQARDLDFRRPNGDAFLASPSKSIDYAVAERTSRAAMIPLDANWSDLGSWSSLWELSAADAAGNVSHGDVVAVDSENCYLRAETRLVAALGVENLVVVETPDAVLVADKDRAQDVKRVVDALKASDRSEPDLHRKVYRPWGSYDSIDADDRFQVKRITVRPGASLSLQMHHHRAEHWIVVAGTGRITRGDEVFMLSENQSTYIPLGVKHRLENPGKVDLELIEVQSGSYLGEDDIVRFEDVYGREEKSAG